MKRYILRKFILLIPLLAGITLITFAMLKLIPGDPVYSMIGERARPEAIEKIRKEIGGEQSFIQQYAGYISLLMRGELGKSLYTNRNISEDIMNKFPKTLLLAAAAMAIAIPAGLFLGALAATSRGGPVDRCVSVISAIGLSMPVFWTGLLLIILFSLKLRISPPSGTGLRYIALPALTLSFPAIAVFARITRTAVIDALSAPHIRTARAKGMSEIRIFVLHVLKNALIPILTVIGLEFGSYLNGAVLTETIFGWDGIGRFAMEGIVRRDYPVVLASIIFGSLVFVSVNIAVDIIHHKIDPRVSENGSPG